LLIFCRGLIEQDEYGNGNGAAMSAIDSSEFPVTAPTKKPH
jgi:hypothetical protein